LRSRRRSSTRSAPSRVNAPTAIRSTRAGTPIVAMTSSAHGRCSERRPENVPRSSESARDGMRSCERRGPKRGHMISPSVRGSGPPSASHGSERFARNDRIESASDGRRRSANGFTASGG